jgi:hypothetical protein
MVPLFGAILCSSESEFELDLIHSRLKLAGLPTQAVSHKNWKDAGEGIKIFSKSTPSLARELLDWSVEPLLYGNFTDTEKENYISHGVSLLWQEPITSLFELPLFMMKQGPCFWSVCTSNPSFDKHIAIILKSFGQLVSVEGETDHLISRLRTNPVNIVLIDWDEPSLDLQKIISTLRKLKEEKQILFIGIKNFEKENLYRDLAFGISEISPSLFSYAEILSIIVHSLPVLPKQTKGDLNRVSFRKLEFEFQEKTKPTRFTTVDCQEETNVLTNEEISQKAFRALYKWLFNRSF